MTDPGGAERLVQSGPVGDPVAQTGGDKPAVVRKAGRGLARRPPTGLLQWRRQIPVIERREGPDPGREQIVDQSVVVVEAGRV
jgi:hypothetical protein